MNAKIISQNKFFILSLSRYLENVFFNIEAENLFLVDINTSLEEAKKYVTNSNNIIILIGIENEDKLCRNNDFLGLMAMANVGFVNAGQIINILTVYKEIASGAKKLDSTALALAKAKERERLVAALRHDIYHVENNQSKLAAWLEKAHEAGFAGTFEQIKEAVLSRQSTTSGFFEGEFLEGIFIDAFETLFDNNWRLDSVVMLAANNLARNQGKKIFVISDSDQNFVEEKLHKCKIDWPLLSKYELRGSTLEVVIDNLSEGDFKNLYKIDVKKFLGVKELLKL